jgi:hypothetical protein
MSVKSRDRVSHYPRSTMLKILLLVAIATAQSGRPDEQEAKEQGKQQVELAASMPVRVKGLEFAALVQKRIPVPPLGTSQDVAVGLRVKNVSQEPITIPVFDVIRPSVFNTVDGVKLAAQIGRNGPPKAVPPVTLGPGKTWTWEPRAKLDWSGDRATLRLGGPDGLGVPGFWSITTLKVGTHRLSIDYSNNNINQDDATLWVGRATTNEVEFRIVSDEGPNGTDGMAVSKAARANGADFQAVIETPTRMPAVGSRWPLTLGLLPSG